MENYCTIYSHELCFDKILKEIQNSFPTAKTEIIKEEHQKIIHTTIKNGLLKPKKEFQISYRERLKPSFNLLEIDSPLTQNIAGMSSFVKQLPTSNEKIKGLLLEKIATLNSEFAILNNGDLHKDLKQFTLNVSQACDAILFIPANTNLKKSDTQQFLDKNLELILDLNGNSEIQDLKVKIDSSLFDKNQNLSNPDQINRKSKSESILKQHSIKQNKNLPYIISEEKVTIRTTKEISERLCLLATINMVAFNSLEAEQAKEYLKQHQLLEKATPNELEFLNNPTEEAKNRETWKCEGIWVLFWALGIVPTLNFPKELADLNTIAVDKYPIGPEKDPHVFINSKQHTREASEILNANDLYYRINWACVDARIKDENLENIHPGVVYERHYALNWLINYRNQEWDQVSCDT